MKTLINYAIVGIIGLLSLIGVIHSYSSSPIQAGDASTGFPNGLSIGGGTYAVDPVVAITGNQTLSGSMFSGGLQSTGAIVSSSTQTRGGSLSTTTAASMTLAPSDLRYSLISPNIATALTMTLPASTTAGMSLFLPNAGDSVTIGINNATTTATNLTLAGGTGSLLRTSTTTLIVYPGAIEYLNCVRKINTDIHCVMYP